MRLFIYERKVVDLFELEASFVVMPRPGSHLSMYGYRISSIPFLYMKDLLKGSWYYHRDFFRKLL